VPPRLRRDASAAELGASKQSLNHATTGTVARSPGAPIQEARPTRRCRRVCAGSGAYERVAGPLQSFARRYPPISIGAALAVQLLSAPMAVPTYDPARHAHGSARDSVPEDEGQLAYDLQYAWESPAYDPNDAGRLGNADVGPGFADDLSPDENPGLVSELRPRMSTR